MSARFSRPAIGVALLALALLAGCGKKPAALEPPEGAGPEAASFPHTYPNPKYDPKPAGGAAARGGEAKAAPPAAAAPPSAESLFPKVIRPEDLTNSSTLSLPGSGR